VISWDSAPALGLVLVLELEVLRLGVSFCRRRFSQFAFFVVDFDPISLLLGGADLLPLLLLLALGRERVRPVLDALLTEFLEVLIASIFLLLRRGPCEASKALHLVARDA